MKTKWIVIAMAVLFMPAAIAQTSTETVKAAPSAEHPALSPEKGKRGVTISAPSSQTSYIKSGDYVDVLITFNDATGRKVTATILQDVRILAIKPHSHEQSNVTLEINMNEAQYLALSDQSGVVTLVARAEGDHEKQPMEIASFRKMFSTPCPVKKSSSKELKNK